MGIGLHQLIAVLHDVADGFFDLVTARPARPARLQMNLYLCGFLG